MVVRDLHDSLGAERLPGEVATSIPSTGRARDALARRFKLGCPFGPVAPRVVVHRVLAQRLALVRKGFALLHREGRCDANVVECALTVEQAQQQRADVRLADFVPAEAGDDAVSGPLVLDLEHRAFARLVSSVERFGDDAVEPGPLEALEPTARERPITRSRRQVKPLVRA